MKKLIPHNGSGKTIPSNWINCALWFKLVKDKHYCFVIIRANASQITSLPIVYSTVYSGVDERKHQSSASLTFVRRILRWPVNSPNKWSVTRKMFPFDDVIMYQNTQDAVMTDPIVSDNETLFYQSAKNKDFTRTYCKHCWNCVLF